MMAAAMELGLLPSHGELCLQHHAEGIRLEIALIVLKIALILLKLHTQCTMTWHCAHTQWYDWQHADCVCQNSA